MAWNCTPGPHDSTPSNTSEKAVEQHGQANPTYKLHSINEKTKNDLTPRCWVRLGRSTQHPALIDTASDFSWIDESLIPRHTPRAETGRHLRLELGDNSTRFIRERTVSLPTRIGDHTGITTFRVMPNAKCLILGTDWLNQFEAVSFVWKEKLMELRNEQGTKSIPLIEQKDQPAKKPGVKSVSLHRLTTKTATRRYEQIFMATLHSSSEPKETTPPAADEEHTKSPEEKIRESLDKQMNRCQLPQDEQREMRHLLDEFIDRFTPDEDLPQRDPKIAARHAHHIRLEPSATPMKGPLYHMAPRELAELRRQLDLLLKYGHVRPSQSPWGAPCLFALKKDGSLRFCVDYRRLNLVTIKDCTAVPLIKEILSNLSGSTIFSALDFHSGYHQIPIFPPDIPKTAFRTRFGNFEWTVMPFGLCNAPATFVELMNRTFSDLMSTFLEIYVDDLLIHSKTFEMHLDHLRQVFTRMRSADLTAKPKKCFFGVTEVPYMGYIIGQNSIRPDPDKVATLKNYPRPRTVNEMERLLGLLKYLRIFIPRFTDTVEPLQAVIRTKQLRKGRDSTSISWTPTMETAMEQLLKVLTEPPVLVLPDPTKKKKIVGDGSAIASGFALLQLEKDERWHPILYHSIKKKPYQQAYGPYDSETLCMVTALDFCRPYIFGQQIVIETDHDALKFLMSSKKQISHRHARWLDRLLEYNPVINYLPGKQNGLADALSRLARVTALANVEAEGASSEQPRETTTTHSTELAVTTFDEKYEREAEKDPFVKRIRDRLASGQLDHFTMEAGKIFYWGHLGERRLVIPRGVLQNQLLQEAHDSVSSGHLGRDRTLDKLSRNYYFPRMARIVRQYVASCPTCQACKGKGAHPEAYSPEGMTLMGERWEHISMDFVTHLPETSEGFNAIWTIVDRISKRAHFLPCKQSDAADKLAEHYVQFMFRLHGMPLSILSDRDPKFVSDFWTSLWKKAGTKLPMSTTNRPQTDGQSEVANRSIGIMIRMYVNYFMTDWADILPILEFAHNSAANTTTGLSPFEADLGYVPRNPFDAMAISTTKTNTSHEEFLLRQQNNLRHCHDAIRWASTLNQLGNAVSPPEYEVGQLVLVLQEITRDPNEATRPKEKWKPTYVGPFPIEAKISKYVYRVKFTDDIKVHPVVNVTALKPYVPNDDEQFPHRKIDAPPPTGPEEQEEWAVQEVISHKLSRRCPYFLTRFTGYPNPDYRDKWLRWDLFFSDDADTVNEKFLKYVERHPEATHPKLRHWLRAHNHLDLPEES